MTDITVMCVGMNDCGVFESLVSDTEICKH